MTRIARPIAFFARILAIVCVVSLANPYTFARSGSNNARVHLAPNFAPGQTFRYAVETRIETTSIATGPIRNMGGPKELSESVGVVIRLDVLSSDAPGGPASARIRATYEKSAATSNAGYDPDVAAAEDQYKKLAGQTVEFTLQADGKITGVTGLKDLASDSDPSRAAMLNQWLSQVTLGASLPKQGIAIGEKWSSQQPLDNVPLDGLSWKTTETYEHDEPCTATSQPSKAANAPVAPAASSEQCAIIMSHSEIVGGRDNKERTPEVFRQNGLRTSGVWTGTADSLVAISLRTGIVSSVTQTGATHMDFTIMTTVGQNRMRYAGDTRTQSEITLLSPSAVP
ncbi:MAG: hypothetical protein WAN10_14995 [Candidatus Acidiferrales bacterium]